MDPFELLGTALCFFDERELETGGGEYRIHGMRRRFKQVLLLQIDEMESD
jgi:hypothetical protein